MAATSSERTMPPGFVFCPRGRELIEYYLVPKACRGDIIPACHVADGIDVFSASPDALPFSPNHRREDEEVWGYFFASQPAGERHLAPGGCWLPYGPEKAYCFGNGGEAAAFRRRFAFHVPWQGGFNGEEMWLQTRWQMKEYRLNKGAAAYRGAHHDPRANIDCVLRKFFTKPMVPPPLLPPAHTSDEESTCSDYRSMGEEAGCSREGQPRKRARFG